jgi:flagellin FlaB
MGWLRRNRRAISGLETAIVLIAFVIVASAFSYAVLNMGFLATQKSQQVVLGGLGAASSALVVDGPVYGYSDQTPGPNAQLTTIMFWLKTASGASSVDLGPDKTTITFQNPRGLWPNIYYCSDGFGTNPSGISTAAQASALCPGVSTDDATSHQAQYVSLNNEYYYTGLGATTLYWETGTGMQLSSGDKVRVTIDLTQIGVSATQPSGQGSDSSNQGGASGLVNKNEAFEIIVKPPIGSYLTLESGAPPQISQVDDLTSIGAGNIGGATNLSPPTGGGTTTIAATSTTSATTTAATNQGEINPNPPVAGQPFTITASNSSDVVIVGGNCFNGGVTGFMTASYGSLTLTLSAGQYSFEIPNEVSCTFFTVVPAS